MLQADGIVTNFYAKLGTMGMADVQNQMGGLPVRNFSAGQLANVAAGEKFKMGGDYIGQLNTSRGGEQTHACMPGCVIQCSNVYARRRRQGSRLAGGVRDARPARHQLRPHRSRRPRPAQLRRQRPGRRHHRDRRHAGRADGGRPRRVRRREVHGRLPGRDPQRHREGPAVGAGHGAGGRALPGRAGAGHQEAGDQRLRPARGRGHRHHHDGHGPGRRPHRRQPAAAQDARDGPRARCIEQSLSHQTRRAPPPTRSASASSA